MKDLESVESEWLATIERFHHTLKGLSDRLSPPYIEDSLPLALKSMLELWRAQTSTSALTLSLPADWRAESYDCSQVILTSLRELLQIVQSAPDPPESIAVHLSLQGKWGELSVQFSEVTPSILIAGDRATALRHLSRAFQFLTSGECFHRHTPQTLTCYFRWQSSLAGQLPPSETQL